MNIPVNEVEKAILVFLILLNPTTLLQEGLKELERLQEPEK